MKRDAMKLRYSITPQMREYDKIGNVWAPYLMYFHAPNYSSDVINTDSRGFRVTYKDSKKISNFSETEKSGICLLVGGSCAFGIGATNDKYTIPSMLNSMTDYLWFNFGGRAFGSTQELLLFLSFHQCINNIKKIVILSGLNNIVLYYLSKAYSKEHGSFFFSELYNKQMNRGTSSFKRKTLNALLKVLPGKKPKEDLIASGKSKEDLLYVLKRDMLNWKLLTDSLGIELYYALQPVAGWINKKLSKEERLLFSELDKLPQNQWKILKNNMGMDQYEWFSKEIKEICNGKKIHFFDTNQLLSNEKLDGKWIFVDRAHLTDEGNSILSDAISKEVGVK